MKELYSDIEIHAPAERVWQVLTSFERFPEWNPFIRSIKGEPGEGERLEVYLQPSGAAGMTFRPKVLEVIPNTKLRWLGRLLLPGLFDGEHRFEIQPLGEDNVRFVQSEAFRGLLVPLLSARLDRDTRRGFEEMNLALKERVENQIESLPRAAPYDR